MDDIDSRSTNDLIDAALTETDAQVVSEIILTLQSRGTLEVFDAAYQLCINQDSQKRILGLRLLEDLGTLELAFPNETLDLTVHLVKKESHPGVLASAARVLARIGGPKSIDSLDEIRRNPSTEVRYGVVMAISHFLHSKDRSGVLPIVLSLTNDVLSGIRFEAVAFLAENSDMDSEEIRNTLIQSSKDSVSGVRGEALLGLVRRNDPRVLDLLMNELKSDKISVGAVNAAAELKHPGLYPLLQEISAWWNVDIQALDKAIQNCTPA